MQTNNELPGKRTFDHIDVQFMHTMRSFVGQIDDVPIAVDQKHESVTFFHIALIALVATMIRAIEI